MHTTQTDLDDKLHYIQIEVNSDCYIISSKIFDEIIFRRASRTTAKNGY